MGVVESKGRGGAGGERARGDRAHVPREVGDPARQAGVVEHPSIQAVFPSPSPFIVPSHWCFAPFIVLPLAIYLSGYRDA